LYDHLTFYVSHTQFVKIGESTSSTTTVRAGTLQSTASQTCYNSIVYIEMTE